MKESDLQQAVANYLSAQEKFRKSFTWFHPTTLSPNRKYGGIMKGRGSKPGLPDCVLFTKGGKTLSIELKLPKARLSPAQKEFHANLMALNHPVYLVRSEHPHGAVKQVEQILKGEGLI